MYYYLEQKRWLINYDNGISQLLMLRGAFKYCEIYLARGDLLYVFVKCFFFLSLLCAALFCRSFPVISLWGKVVYFKHLLWWVVMPKEVFQWTEDITRNREGDGGNPEHFVRTRSGNGEDSSTWEGENSRFLKGEVSHLFIPRRHFYQAYP